MDSNNLPPEFSIASRFRRFSAYIFDMIFLLFILSLLNIKVGFMDKYPDETLFFGLKGNVFAFVSFIIYFVFSHKVIGSTIGKLLFNIKVVNNDGKPPSFLPLLGKDLLSLRYVTFWFTLTPLGVFSFGSTLTKEESGIYISLLFVLYYLFQNGFIFFNKNNKSFADKICKINVVRL